MEPLKDTSKLQLASLKAYMKQLGYEYFGVDIAFHSGFYVNKSREWISFNKAVQLHNGLYNEVHGNPWFEEPFHTIPYEFFLCAEKEKLVQKVKMQKSYKKGIIVQSHVVDLIDKSNYDLFFK